MEKAFIKKIYKGLMLPIIKTYYKTKVIKIKNRLMEFYLYQILWLKIPEIPERINIQSIITIPGKKNYHHRPFWYTSLWHEHIT